MQIFYFSIFFNFFFCINTYAQLSHDAKRDFVWIFGYNSAKKDTTNNIFLNFNTDTLTLSYKRHVGQNFFQTNASICDTAGNLLFYSNGCVLSDTSSKYIPGADTINKGVRWYVCEDNIPESEIRTDGYNIVNGCWILPVAENRFKIYYTDLINGNAHTSGARFATVNKNPTTGLLTGKDPDTYLIFADLQPEMRGVVRHANGRDYWMVNEAYQDKKYYISFIDSTATIHPSDSQYFAELPEKKFHGGSQGCFSSNGEKYCTVSSYNQCQVFDFDRCTGKLSNVVHIPLPVPYDSIYGSTGIAVSPNSRFMYLMLSTTIWQYDLTASNIDASKIKVAQHDGWIDPYGERIVFYQSQLGPNGKIYIFPPAARRGFHVIEQPDQLGAACQVIQHKYSFPSHQWVVSQPPRFPNFRLGPVVGSPCDTLTVSTSSGPEPIKASITLRPNPATSYTIADLSLTAYGADMELEITLSDLSGVQVGQYRLPPYAALQRVETSALPNGVYFVTLKSKGIALKTEKLVVLRE